MSLITFQHEIPVPLIPLFYSAQNQITILIHILYLVIHIIRHETLEKRLFLFELFVSRVRGTGVEIGVHYARDKQFHE